MKHSGLVTPVGTDPVTGRARWQASCSCSWKNDRTNTKENNAGRALGKHLRAVRTVGGTGTSPGREQPAPPAPR